jgi:hypothetical protein
VVSPNTFISFALKKCWDLINPDMVLSPMKTGKQPFSIHNSGVALKTCNRLAAKRKKKCVAPLKESKKYAK